MNIMRRTLLLIIAALLVSACSLSSERPTVPPTQPPVPPIVSTSISSSQPSATPAVIVVTATRSPTTASAVQPVSNVVPCSLRSDWPIYTVVAGDTLGTIAQRTGSTVNALTQANCLTNANLISTGQWLRVPTLPRPIPTVPPVMTMPPLGMVIGTIAVSPSVYNDAWYRLPSGQNVTIQWVDIQSFISQMTIVQFYLIPTGTGTTVARQFLGTDSYMGDGASINWTVTPGGFSGYIVAEGQSASGYFATSRTLQVYAPPSVTAVPVEEGQIFITPATEADGWYALTPGQTVTILWQGATTLNQAVAVEFYMAPTGTGTYDARQLLGTDNIPSDGAGISWQVAPDGFSAHIWAEAVGGGNILVASSPAVGVFANHPATANP